MSKIKMEKYEDLLTKFSFEKSSFYWTVLFINKYGPPEKFVGIKIYFVINEIKKLRDKTLEYTVRYNACKQRLFVLKLFSYAFPLNLLISTCMAFCEFSFSEQIFNQKKLSKKLLRNLSDVRQNLCSLELLLDKLVKINKNEIPTSVQCEKEYPEFYRWKSSLDIACNVFSTSSKINNPSVVYEHYFSTYSGSSSYKPLKNLIDFVSMQLDLLSILKDIVPKDQMELIEKALQEEKEKRAQYAQEQATVLDVCKNILAPEEFEKVQQYLVQINNQRMTS